MMPTSRAKKEKPPPGPDDLVREAAGVYRTGDGRFEIQKSDVGWYLVDSEQANEFGQQLIHGPLATLDAIRDAIPGLRELKPLLRFRPKKSAAVPSSRGGSTARQKPAAPPPTWIDRLPDKEAASVRRLISTLEKEGLEDAETLVRRHREDPAPVIATRLIERRLNALIAEQPPEERERAQTLVRRVVDIVAVDGATLPRPAPRWALVEVKEDEEPPRYGLRPEV